MHAFDGHAWATPTTTRWPRASSPASSASCSIGARSRRKTEARLAVFTCIEGWYNPRRRHSGLGRVSPASSSKGKHSATERRARRTRVTPRRRLRGMRHAAGGISLLQSSSTRLENQAPTRPRERGNSRPANRLLIEPLDRPMRGTTLLHHLPLKVPKSARTPWPWWQTRSSGAMASLPTSVRALRRSVGVSRCEARRAGRHLPRKALRDGGACFGAAPPGGVRAAQSAAQAGAGRLHPARLQRARAGDVARAPAVSSRRRWRSAPTCAMWSSPAAACDARRLPARCRGARMGRPAATRRQAAAHRVIDTDMAAILYTSGSTGQPKGVVLSHRNMVAGAKSVASVPREPRRATRCWRRCRCRSTPASAS